MISAIGVAGVTSENAQIVSPLITVLTTSTCRNPKRRSTRTEKNFMPIAAIAAGIISRPDCQAGRPRPSW